MMQLIGVCVRKHCARLQMTQVILIMLRIAADYDRLAKHSDDAAAVDALMLRVASDDDRLIERPRKQGTD